MQQVVDLTGYADPNLIDTGTVNFNVSAWLGGRDNQADRVVVSVSFENQTGTTIGSTTTIGPVTNSDRGGVTELLYRDTTGIVPIGARSVTVQVSFIKSYGGYNNGFADNIGIYLYP